MLNNNPPQICLLITVLTNHCNGYMGSLCGKNAQHFIWQTANAHHHGTTSANLNVTSESNYLMLCFKTW